MLADDNKFDAALSQTLQGRVLPEPSQSFATKLQARCALDGPAVAELPPGVTPVYAAAGSLVMGLLIGMMLFSTLSVPLPEAPTAAPSTVLYHYVYRNAV